MNATGAMMSPPRHCLTWDETIRPAKHSSLYSTFNGLSLSPENKRKRRNDETNYETTTSPALTTTALTTTASHSQLFSASHAKPAPLFPHGVHKRARTSRASASGNGLKRRLEALDKQQLVSIVDRLLERQPDLVPVVDQMTPKLKVSQALNELQKHHAKILDNLPLGTPTSDYAFLRVRSLWTSFFVALADYTLMFVYDTQPTDTTQALEYLDAATMLVHTTPRWDSNANNALVHTAYYELSQAWVSTIERASKNASFAYITGEMWETKFREHCARSRNYMVDSRIRIPVVEIPRACQTVIS